MSDSDCTPVADNWEFTKYLPDDEDLSAAVKAWDKTVARLEKEPDLYDFGDVFFAGFYRGCAWAKYRTEQEEQQQCGNSCPDECGCVLPEQSCAICRRAARDVHDSDDDELPF